MEHELPRFHLLAERPKVHCPICNDLTSDMMTDIACSVDPNDTRLPVACPRCIACRWVETPLAEQWKNRDYADIRMAVMATWQQGQWEYLRFQDNSVLGICGSSLDSVRVPFSPVEANLLIRQGLSGPQPKQSAQLDQRSANAPEPPPARGRLDVWPLVIADMKERNEVGTRKYGTPLQTHNGRNALVDAYQEALDLVVYLRQAIEEAKK